MSKSKQRIIDKKLKDKKNEINIQGIDIDKNEYQEIVLSNSNRPDKDFYRNYYD